MATDNLSNICIPIHLDAFVLSPGSCDGPSSLAPYTQPNYTSLRLDSHLIQHDVLDHVDFHLSSPAWNNPRIADLGRTPGNQPLNSNFLNRRQNRMGVHLSWSLPRLYRSAQASGKQQDANVSNSKKPQPNPNPVFRQLPSRWLVIRHVRDWTQQIPLPEWQAWVIESNAVRKITDIVDPNVDIEADLAPFVTYHDDPQDLNLFRSQTEIFLGQKFDLGGSTPWQEPETQEPKTRSHIDSLTVMSSSNPLFADNVLHNTNVLSMIDNFSYRQDGKTKYLEKCNCDYFVLGWHTKGDDDPLTKIPSDDAKDLQSRLSTLLLKLGDLRSGEEKLPTDENPWRTLLHGAIYDVKYDFAWSPIVKQPLSSPNNDVPVRSLVNECAVKFKPDTKMEPLSVGTTPLDAILAFLEAHEPDAESTFGEDTKKTVDLLLSMAELLYASGDNYDSRIQAQDLLRHQAFSKVDGGLNWLFASKTKPGNPPSYPDPPSQEQLKRLNEVQLRRDATTRKLSSAQWQLFAEWWKYSSKAISSKASKSDIEAIRRPIRSRVGTLSDIVSQLSNIQVELDKTLSSNQTVSTFKQTACDPFHSRVDPTLCVAGLTSGWPKDWNSKLMVRPHSDLQPDNNVADKIFGSLANPVPRDNGLDQTARRILSECTAKANTSNGVDTSPQKDGRYQAPSITGFQNWGNRIPFVPIYLEWEGMYFHVGPMKDKWHTELRVNPIGHHHPTIKYTPNGVLSDDVGNHKDFRMVSGRALVLPQPVFSLQALVMQVIDDSGNASGLSDADKTVLRDHIQSIQFVSAPLSGLTNHLLTRFEGAHVKPTVRTQGARKPLALSAAIQPDIGMDGRTLELIDAESALTPYGDTFPFNTAEYPGTAFKPVTHGQLILTKLNVVDKFGQAICLPKLLRRRRGPPDVLTSTIYPCMSDDISPDIARDATGKMFLNTVIADPALQPPAPGSFPPCSYMQLTPAINQDARINGAFLVRDTIDLENKIFTTWREATDYDAIIWGWIIINYADNGLQLFLGDGTFYAEIRRGGVEGTNVSQKWLPYEKRKSGDNPQDAGEEQLSELLQKLRDPTYFQRFADMINGSIINMPFPPSDYSGFANSIVGKPLALVNTGWSLELAQPAFKSQNGLGRRPAWEGEVNNDILNAQPTNAADPLNQADWDKRHAQWDHEVRDDFIGSEISNYTFSLKLGDIERNYDGVVGFWYADNDQDKCVSHFQTVYTYFCVDWGYLPAGTVLNIPTSPPSTYIVVTGDTLSSIANATSTTEASIKAANPQIPDARAPSASDYTFQHIDPINFPQLPPYYLDPLRYTNKIDLSAPIPTTPVVYKPGESIAADRTAQMMVTPMLIDPYTAIHAYSPILPIKKLQLPAFTVEAAFRKMHAFFHLGPMLLTKDVPYSLAAARAKPTATPPTTTNDNKLADSDDIPVVRLPVSGRKGTWSWFQPYASDDPNELDPTYAQIPVDEDLSQDKYVKGPYTYIEGFLQLEGSLAQKRV